jgi:hypothetical protein
LWGVPVVEDGVATYMSVFDQPVTLDMGCSLISSGVVIEEQLPHSHLKNKIHYLHIKQA